MDTAGPGNNSHGYFTPEREQLHVRGPDVRILCPVTGCPASDTSSNKYFRNFNSIKCHLNDHITGHLTGAVPAEFLALYSYSQCRVCDRVLHSRYHGTCMRCGPTACARRRVEVLRQRNSITAHSVPPNQQAGAPQQPKPLPSLSEVHKWFVPTVKSVPLSLRRLWAQCLVRALAQVVWANNVTVWTELLMLPKCTLCVPIRGGKSHTSQRLAWTRGRLQRWLAGERTELWDDLPVYKRPKPKKQSDIYI